MRNGTRGYRLALIAALVLVGLPRVAGAHCDTLDGPVVAAARVALEKADLTPVLRWVKQEHDPEPAAAQHHEH